MNKSNLTFMAWLAVFYAAIQIPSVALYVFAQELAGVSGGKSIEATLNVVNLALFVGLFIALKRLFNQRFGFTQTDRLITAMVFGNILIAAVNLIALVASPLQKLSLGFSVISLIVLGVIGTVYSITLLRLPNNLFGLLKPYAYTFMATSLLYATVLLVPLGMLAGMASTVTLAMIFFRAAESA